MSSVESNTTTGDPLEAPSLSAGAEKVLQSLLVEVRLAASWAHSFAEEEHRHDPSAVFSDRNRQSLKSTLATLNRLSAIIGATPSGQS